jgi:hypothetical protein
MDAIIKYTGGLVLHKTILEKDGTFDGEPNIIPTDIVEKAFLEAEYAKPFPEDTTYSMGCVRDDRSISTYFEYKGKRFSGGDHIDKIFGEMYQNYLMKMMQQNQQNHQNQQNQHQDLEIKQNDVVNDVVKTNEVEGNTIQNDNYQNKTSDKVKTYEKKQKWSHWWLACISIIVMLVIYFYYFR